MASGNFSSSASTIHSMRRLESIRPVEASRLTFTGYEADLNPLISIASDRNFCAYGVL